MPYPLSILRIASAAANAHKNLERKLLFCCAACNDKSYSRLESRFDTSSPYNREVVLRNKESLSASSVIATTNNSTADVSVIDAMLSVLSSPPIPNTASANTNSFSPGKDGKAVIGIAGHGHGGGSNMDETTEEFDNFPPSAGIVSVL